MAHAYMRFMGAYLHPYNMQGSPRKEPKVALILPPNPPASHQNRHVRHVIYIISVLSGGPPLAAKGTQPSGGMGLLILSQTPICHLLAIQKGRCIYVYIDIYIYMYKCTIDIYIYICIYT